MYIIHRRRGGRQRLVQGVGNEEEKKMDKYQYYPGGGQSKQR